MSQNQYNIPNTTAIPVTTAIDYCTPGDNPNVSVEMEDAEEDDDVDDTSGSEDDDGITKVVDIRYPMHNRNKKDTYEPSFRGQQILLPT